MTEERPIWRSDLPDNNESILIVNEEYVPQIVVRHPLAEPPFNIPLLNNGIYESTNNLQTGSQRQIEQANNRLEMIQNVTLFPLEVSRVQNEEAAIVVEAAEASRVQNEEATEQEVAENEEEEEEEEESDHDNPNIKRQKLDDKKETNDVNGSLNDSVDDDQKCSICLEMWSNSGEHRLCSLKCGHLFGMSCILKWIEPLSSAARRCPECNAKTHKRDIRIIYAKKLVSTDTGEFQRVKEDLQLSQIKLAKYEEQLFSYKMKEQAYETQIAAMSNHIESLEKALSNGNMKRHSVLTKVHNFEMCTRGSCRVMAYNPWHRMLITSMKNPNQTNSGDNHGIRKVMLDSLSYSSFLQTHSNTIRDVAFATGDQHLCLTVGFDQQIVLGDLRSFSVAHKYSVHNNMLWSCCWSRETTYNFFVGTNDGHIFKYDLRNLSQPLEALCSNDKSPVVSLASIASYPSFHSVDSGFIACHLNSCDAYMYQGNTYTKQGLDLQGPFTSVRYDTLNKHVLISCRGSSSNQNVRHNVCLIYKTLDRKVQCEYVHTLNGGSKQQRLSRPCHVYLENQTFVAASNETTNCVQMWNMKTGEEVNRLPVNVPILDMASFRICDTYLSLLTPNGVLLYKYNESELNIC